MVCRDVFWELVRRNEAFFGNKFGIVYDDASALFTLQKLPIENGCTDFMLEWKVR